MPEYPKSVIALTPSLDQTSQLLEDWISAITDWKSHADFALLGDTIYPINSVPKRTVMRQFPALLLPSDKDLQDRMEKQKAIWNRCLHSAMRRDPDAIVLSSDNPLWLEHFRKSHESGYFVFQIMITDASVSEFRNFFISQYPDADADAYRWSAIEMINCTGYSGELLQRQ